MTSFNILKFSVEKVDFSEILLDHVLQVNLWNISKCSEQNLLQLNNNVHAFHKRSYNLLCKIITLCFKSRTLVFEALRYKVTFISTHWLS